MTKPTRIGAMREQILVERSADVADGYGGFTKTWSTVHTLMSRVQSVRGQEADVGGRRSTVETYLFIVRYGPTINEDDRISWNGRTWDITNVADREGRRMFLTIEATAGSGTA